MHTLKALAILSLLRSRLGALRIDNSVPLVMLVVMESCPALASEISEEDAATAAFLGESAAAAVEDILLLPLRYPVRSVNLQCTSVFFKPNVK